jgi:hypothetical protein
VNAAHATRGARAGRDQRRPARATPPARPPARKRITLLALCLAAFIISLDVTIVNVALPSLVRQTGATTTDLQWSTPIFTSHGCGGFRPYPRHCRQLAQAL